MTGAVPDAGRPSNASRVFFALLVNAVSLVGVLRYRWSAVHVLAMYWIELLLVALCTAIRLRARCLHGRRRFGAGLPCDEQAYAADQFGVVFNAFMVFFVLFEGLFLKTAGLAIERKYPHDPMWRYSSAQIMHGALLLCAMFGIDLLAGLRNVADDAGAWGRGAADDYLRRFGVLHMALWFGMLVMHFIGSPFGYLVALMVLKTFADVSSAMGWRGWSGRP